MQVQRTKSKSELEYNSTNPINLNQEEVEKKILNRFNFLQQEKSLHLFFSSYDYRIEEKNMVEMWEKIIDYLLTDIFSSFATTMSDLKKYTIVKNKIPIGLNNIMQQLRIEQKYVTEEDLKSDKFYQLNFPDLYPQPKGYVTSFLSGLQSIINFTGGKMGCKEDNDNNDQQMVVRTDFTEEDKYKNILESTVLFNYDKFRTHCQQVLQVLKDISIENDEEIIPVNNFKKIVQEKYIKKGDISGRLTLNYGLQYIECALFYLMKLKKIALFEIQSNNKNIECIKLFKNQDDTVTEKDQAIAKLLVHIELLDKTIQEYQKKMDNFITQAKQQLKNGNKQGARIIMIKKKNYQKFLENSQNTQNVLEQQIFDLKNAESNASVTDVLKQCLEAEKQIGMNPDDFAEVADDLKDAKQSLNEVNAGMREFIDENEEDELNKEMEKLMIDNKKEKELEFPNPNKEKIDENKEFEDLLK